MANEDLIARIERRLLATGKTAREASIDATGKPDVIRAIMRGTTTWPRADTMHELARALGTSEAWLSRGEGVEEPALLTTDVRDLPNFRPPDRNAMEMNLPLLGTVAGSHTRGAVQLIGVVDYVRRPPALVGRRKAYALMVDGDSMHPEHPRGALRMVDPEAKVHFGDTVVIQTTSGAMDDVEASIGHYLKKNASHTLLGKLNPKAELAIENRVIIAVHRVLTMNDLFGI